ncbi:MAG TPA: glutamate--tRNA ligase [archaeon]|nr:glutamate--tRNA ligase [archaeon]
MDKIFRARFAPSPTGRLHIGNARTAILNWLLARRLGGCFILRIEDTDLARSTPESEKAILDDLRWLGLDWDEGPDVGGPYAPYRQSERGELYQAAAGKLIERGLAYYCHLSDEEKEQFRQQRLAEGKLPVYRGELSGPNKPDESGRPASIRFRVPPGESSWNDLVKGEVVIDHRNIGDFIILRSDGRPTYNFAAVVDDIAMRASHVIRGDDHLSNTPRQLMLYKALEAEQPSFAHIPMILGPDHQRLSKRHGATSVADFRSSGCLPEALINYLSLLSWSSGSGEEFLPPERLKAEIDFERLGKSAAIFDPTKMRWLNGKYIRALPEEKLAALLLEFAGEEARAFSNEQFRQIVLACRDKLELLTDISKYLGAFSGKPPVIDDPEALDLIGSPEARKVLPEMARGLRKLGNGDVEQMKVLFNTVGKSVSVRGKMLYMPVRIALTGSFHGPDLPRVMAVLGAERCAQLLERADSLA